GSSAGSRPKRICFGASAPAGIEVTANVNAATKPAAIEKIFRIFHPPEFGFRPARLVASGRVPNDPRETLASAYPLDKSKKLTFSFIKSISRQYEPTRLIGSRRVISFKSLG